jgi:phage N-6-adenine-methyltransferase
MSIFDKNKFKSESQVWETPDWLFDQLNKEFHFTIDVCASIENKRCDTFYSEQNSCLDKTWSGVCWMNPPYKNMKQFIKKAYDERNNAVTVCLIPARTNTLWWHEWCMKAEVRFICGRPAFKGCVHGLPQPLAIVIFGTHKSGQLLSFYKGEKPSWKKNQ